MYPPERVLPKLLANLFYYRGICNLILSWGGLRSQALKIVYCECHRSGFLVIVINQILQMSKALYTI